MAKGAPIGGLFVRISTDYADFVSGLDKADKAITKFSRKFSEHAKSAAEFTAAIGAAGVAIFEFTKKATDMLDELAKMSQKIGVSVESLSAFKYAAQLSGVSLDQLRTGLQYLNKNMADMQAGTGEAKQAFDGMGISVVDAQGHLKGTEAMLLELADRFSKMQDSAGKTALAMRIFGRSGAELIPFLNEGREGIGKLREEAEKLGVVFSSDVAKAAEEFNDDLQRIKDVVTGIHTELAMKLVPALGEAAKAFLEAKKEGMGFFDAMREGFGVMFFGNDLNRWNKEFTETTEKMLSAQNRLDQANQRLLQTPTSVFWKTEVEARRKVVDELQAELDRLQRIKPVLAPEVEKQKPKIGTQEAPKIANATEIERARKRAIEATKEDLDEQQQIVEDAAKIFLAKQKQRLDEEEAQRKAAATRAIAATQEEIEEQQQIAEDAWKVEQVIAKQKEAQKKAELAATDQFLGNLAGLMNTGSKRMFELGKKAAIAQALYKGSLAVMDAWEAGMSTGGPWAPFIAAGFAAAAGLNALNLVNNIRSQQFEGGGGFATPVSAGQGSSGIVQNQGLSGSGQGIQQVTNVRLEGDTFGRKQLRDFFNRIEENTRDGGVVRVLS